jgi:hypothetical protein
VRYVAPAIEHRTPVSALMTTPISPGLPSPRWKKSREADGDDARSDG